MTGAPAGLLVRPIGPEDSLSELTEFLHRAYAHLAEMGFQFFATYQDEAATERRVRSGECYLAFLEGRLVGTVTFREPARSKGCPFYERGDVATFSQLAVDPDMRGLEIGRRLLDLVERRAAETGAAEIACDTAEGATHLIRMYERRGFRFVTHVDWRPVTNYRSVVLSKVLGQ